MENRPTRQVAARWRIVEGAVGMVEMALSRLTERGVVELDWERTASMVSNLMAVLRAQIPAAHAGRQCGTPIVKKERLRLWLRLDLRLSTTRWVGWGRP